MIFRSDDRILFDDDREPGLTEEAAVHLNYTVLVDDHVIEHHTIRNLNILEKHAVRHTGAAPDNASAE